MAAGITQLMLPRRRKFIPYAPPESPQTLADRRRARRARVRRDVEVMAGVVVEEAEHEFTFFTHTLDLSETGMSILVHRPSLDIFDVEESGQLRIVLSLPGGAITVAAIPVHVRPVEGGGERGHVVGLKITVAGDGERARLRDFLRGLG